MTLATHSCNPDNALVIAAPRTNFAVLQGRAVIRHIALTRISRSAALLLPLPPATMPDTQSTRPPTQRRTSFFEQAHIPAPGSQLLRQHTPMCLQQLHLQQLMYQQFARRAWDSPHVGRSAAQVIKDAPAPTLALPMYPHIIQHRQQQLVATPPRCDQPAEESQHPQEPFPSQQPNHSSHQLLPAEAPSPPSPHPATMA